MKHILVTDKVHPRLLKGLENYGMNVTYKPKMPYEEVKKVAHSYNGIIINSKVICDKKFLTSHQHLDFIGRLGSGLDIIDLAQAKELGVEIINSPEGNANAVAEHAIGMLLCLVNNIARANQEVHQFIWNREPNRGFELEGRTIGIYGFGHTGSALAHKLQTWGVNLIAYDKYRTEIEADYPYVKSVNLDQLLDQSDILSVHLPLTAETRGIVDQSLLQKCKKGLILINTSRGPIVDTVALADQLEAGTLAGACLDVLENEKLDTLSQEQESVYQRLFKLDQVILTPHIAGWTQESLVKIADYLLMKIGRFYGL